MVYQLLVVEHVSMCFWAISNKVTTSRFQFVTIFWDTCIECENLTGLSSLMQSWSIVTERCSIYSRSQSGGVYIDSGLCFNLMWWCHILYCPCTGLIFCSATPSNLQKLSLFKKSGRLERDSRSDKACWNLISVAEERAYQVHYL